MILLRDTVTGISVMYVRTNLHHTPVRSSMELGSGLHCQMLPRATEPAIRASRENPKDRNGPSFDLCLPHLFSTSRPT